MGGAPSRVASFTGAIIAEGAENSFSHWESELFSATYLRLLQMLIKKVCGRAVGSHPTLMA
jgi:hypothetical protein